MATRSPLLHAEPGERVRRAGCDTWSISPGGVLLALEVEVGGVGIGGEPCGERLEDRALDAELGHRSGPYPADILRFPGTRSYAHPTQRAAWKGLSVPGMKRLLVGRPIPTSAQAGERLVKVLALAVFSSDAISSTAYATEEILHVLVPKAGWPPSAI